MSDIFILSGAGLSAESGIKTFRDHNGLWENFDVMEVCSTKGWDRDREKVTNFYNQRRADLKDKEPNSMHFFLRDLERKYPNNTIHLTQNVDNLCEKAGAKNLIHLHGTLTDLRCEECGHVWNIGYEQQKGHCCPHCKSLSIRHNVVMFGEPAPMYKYLYQSINRCKVFIAIGTSGQVIDVVPMAKEAPYSIYLNLKRELYTTSFGDFDEYIDEFFDETIIGKATQTLDKLQKAITIGLNS